MTLSREDEDTEIFIEDYTRQIRMMNKMSDLQIKVLLKQLIVEDPEWFDLLRTRFKRKQMRIAKELAKEVCTDIHGSIESLARKVA